MKRNSAETGSRGPRLSAAAQRHHEELFQNHQSQLKISDPELIEIFDNFAFDEVVAVDGLDVKTRMMVILAALIGSQAANEYRIMAGAALNVGVTPVELKEILYQAVPYVGMARVFDFLHCTNEVLTQRGIVLPLEGQSTTGPEDRHAKGLATQKAIFGEMIDRLYETSPADQLHIQRFLSANCFGDFYTRTGLDLWMRELVTLALLISFGGVDAQIKGHIQGNLNIGNDRAVLVRVVTQLLPWVGYPRTLNAFKCLNEIAPLAKTPGSEGAQEGRGVIPAISQQSPQSSGRV